MILQIKLVVVALLPIYLSGASRGPGAPLLLDQTEARRAEKILMGERPPPPLLS